MVLLRYPAITWLKNERGRRKKNVTGKESVNGRENGNGNENASGKENESVNGKRREKKKGKEVKGRNVKRSEKKKGKEKEEDTLLVLLCINTPGIPQMADRRNPTSRNPTLRPCPATFLRYLSIRGCK